MKLNDLISRFPPSGGPKHAGVRRRERVVEHGAADTGRRCTARSSSSTSGRTRASTGSGRCRTSARGPTRTPTTGSSWSVCTRPSSASSTTSTTCAARYATWASSTRSRSTTTTPCGMRSRTSTGPRSTSPTHEGRIRHHHFGEGGYETVGARHSPAVDRRRRGRPAASSRRRSRRAASSSPRDWHNVRSAETYVGHARSEGFASPGGAAFDEPRVYTVPSRLHLNEWALAGDWTVGREEAVSNAAERPHRVPLPRA